MIHLEMFAESSEVIESAMIPQSQLASDEEMVEGTIGSRLPLLSVMHSVEVSSRAGNQQEKSLKGVALRNDLDRICCNNQMTIEIEYLDCHRRQQLEVPVNDGVCRLPRL